jgi:hypothetical protein
VSNFYFNPPIKSTGPVIGITFSIQLFFFTICATLEH